MTDLKAFMAGNALPVQNRKVAVSPRFTGEDGQPVEWELRAITSDENERIQNDCTQMVPAPGKAGKRGQLIPRVNVGAYKSALAAACIVYPNLHDAELQDSYHVKEPGELLNRMLLPGEYDALLEEIQSLCGFDVTLQDRVDEAKN